MSVYIVDASVAAKWFTDEDDATAALMLLDGRHALHAPDFFALEMDSVLCKWIRRGIVTEPEADEIRATFGQLPIQYHPFRLLQDSAYAIANRTGLSLYDGLYVALAALLKGRLVTADRQLHDRATAGSFGMSLQWVGDLAPD